MPVQSDERTVVLRGTGSLFLITIDYDGGRVKSYRLARATVGDAVGENTMAFFTDLLSNGNMLHRGQLEQLRNLIDEALGFETVEVA